MINNHSGHRKRLRKRLMQNDVTPLSDLTLVELLLTFSIPRKDVQPIAEQLIKKFGSVNGLLEASNDDIKSITGVGGSTLALIILIRKIAERLGDVPSSAPEATGETIAIPKPRSHSEPRYNAQLTAGTLLIHETRKIAKLMLERGDAVDWHYEIFTKNILQRRNPKTASRVSRLIRNRLDLVGKDILKLITEGDLATAIQATLAAAIKHSKLLGDFMRDVVREHYRTYKTEILRREWDQFLKSASSKHPEIDQFSDSTKHKIGSHVYKILAEAGYLYDTKKLELRRITLLPQVRECLLNNDEQYVLDCMDIT